MGRSADWESPPAPPAVERRLEEVGEAQKLSQLPGLCGRMTGMGCENNLVKARASNDWEKSTGSNKHLRAPCPTSLLPPGIHLDYDGCYFVWGEAFSSWSQVALSLLVMRTQDSNKFRLLVLSPPHSFYPTLLLCSDYPDLPCLGAAFRPHWLIHPPRWVGDKYMFCEQRSTIRLPPACLSKVQTVPVAQVEWNGISLLTSPLKSPLTRAAGAPNPFSLCKNIIAHMLATNTFTINIAEVGPMSIHHLQVSCALFWPGLRPPCLPLKKNPFTTHVEGK
ncbi:unnamed protein product [Protopolystoma xenopodis]|uniref:Uncharacterized protein n=1 Tax=Protopolystoma xenopodis TaxID=117903 RepID=A0A448WGH0_9PLAT|nr:unnamed protein product [Protopolystoma xenopodis]